MPMHQQLWSLECSVIQTVASLLRGVTEHCLAGIQSHCPDKVDNIQAIRKSSTDRCRDAHSVSLCAAARCRRHQTIKSCVTVLANFCCLRINEKDVFHSKKLQLLPSAFSRIGISNGTAVLMKCLLLSFFPRWHVPPSREICFWLPLFFS